MKIKPVFLGLFLALVFVPSAFGQSESREKASSSENLLELKDLTQIEFKGDLDEMIKRRLIRVLVAYSKTHYFIDHGTQRGLTYESFRRFENHLNKKLKKRHIRVSIVFVPVARDEMMPALVDGRGDIAAANLTITPERRKQADFTDPTTTNVSEIVVAAPGTKPVTSLKDLSGREVYVRKSSSYYESIRKLNAKLAKDGLAPARVRPAPENLETEDILEMVNAGLVGLTIVDDHLARFWKKVFEKIVLYPDVAVRTGGNIGVMLRKNCPQLKKELNAFFKKYPKGNKTRNILLQRYLKRTKYVKNATSEAEMAKFNATVDFFKKYGDRYALDYLLMIAQGYQESRLNQSARNPSGAVGIMQVLPSTAKDLNVGDITKLEPNIHAGVKYIRFMLDRYYADEPMDPLNRALFSFASYNAGPARVKRLRREAAKSGLDPNKWFNHVEVIAAKRVGRETVQYVSNIYKYYLAYKMVVEQHQERRKIKEGLLKGAKRQ